MANEILKVVENVSSNATHLPLGDSSLTEDEKTLFKNVPEEGDTIGNKSLRKLLNWDEQKYWEIRDGLVLKGYISTGMGRGGSVFRLRDVTENLASNAIVQPANGASYTAERQLYGPVAEALNKWAKELQFTNYFIEDVSSQGSRRTGGVWTRPDIVLINVGTYQFVPNKFLEVITFEIKPDDGWEIAAVFEAAAHSRFSSQSYLAIHFNKQNPPSQDLEDRIADECKRFGVGLIVFEDPNDFDSFDFRIEPLRKSYDPRAVEQFIETQISTENKGKLSRWLR